MSSGSPAAAAEWRRRVVAEYRSAVIAQRTTLLLLQVGAPADLVRQGLRVVDDELTHSEMAMAVAIAAGGPEDPPAIDLSVLAPADASAPLAELGEAVLRYFCIGETVAVPLFQMLRANATQPPAKEALDRVMADEGRHRQFGWDVLDWLLLVTDDVFAARLAEQVPPLIEGAAAAYASSPSTRLDPSAATWGLAAPRAYAEVFDRCVAEQLQPRFAGRGLWSGNGAQPTA